MHHVFYVNVRDGFGEIFITRSPPQDINLDGGPHNRVTEKYLFE